MDKLLTTAPQRLAKNIEVLRRTRGLSQVQLAEVAAIPRTTLTHMESGYGNPSLQNLLKVAGALQVSVEELLSLPRSEVELIKAKDIPKVVKKGGVSILKLLPDPVPGMEIDRIEVEPLGRMKGTPHLAKTKEYFYCTQGSMEIFLNKKRYDVSKGDVIAFPGDLPHGYVNPSKSKVAVGFSVVVLNHGYLVE